MIIGVPLEIKIDEYRVAITPAGVAELIKDGHSVYVQNRAGIGSGFSDDAYKTAGAVLLEDSATLYDMVDIIVKVKEPIASEYELFKTHKTIFKYIHLDAD